MANLPNFQTDHEQYCFNNAVSFSAVRGVGRKRTRSDFNTYDEALAFASQFTDGRTMVYAITDMGFHAHITNA